MSLAFRWLGAAGVELRAGNQVLAIDPFFTRPTLLQMMHPVQPAASLVIEKLPACNVVLVTHSHYDHLLDVPIILENTGAQAFGSANTCQLLRLSGVPEAQITQVKVGQKLSLDAFTVEVIQGQHSLIPLGGIFNGRLAPGLKPPLRVQDYRMDTCFGYYITAMGLSLLVCAAEPHPAHILFAVAQESRSYYLKLFQGTSPQAFIPIHWDNFTRPLRKPLKRFSRPGGMPLWMITRLARQVMPRLNVIIPEIFREYTLAGS